MCSCRKKHKVYWIDPASVLDRRGVLLCCILQMACATIDPSENGNEVKPVEKILWTLNQMPACKDEGSALMTRKQVEGVRAFHRSFPQYHPTPLQNLAAMAKELGLGGLYVKDESYRFDLNAFKVLGGSYAIARKIAALTGQPMEKMTYTYLTGPILQRDFPPVTFYTATDGNHGRGVAWAARQLGQQAVVRMPKGTSQRRLENIRKEGATVTIENMNYDDCVRLAAREAAQNPGSVLMQDTAWDGYEEIPGWIMQGYGTMAAEAVEQLESVRVQRPTHVFVQAGVGSLAGAMAGYFANCFPENPPKVVVVEARAADCHYRSAVAGDIRTVEGDLATMMAGLACGEPNPISWAILRNHAHAFISCPDWVSALGMRMLAAPCKGDMPVTSGESGAVGMGLIAAIMQSETYRDLRTALQLDQNSHVLLFSTEGDTDPAHYRRIIWGGEEETI